MISRQVLVVETFFNPSKGCSGQPEIGLEQEAGEIRQIAKGW
jgi:hypothetical protein